MSHQVHWVCLRKMANRKVLLARSQHGYSRYTQWKQFLKVAWSFQWILHGRETRWGGAGWNMPSLICCAKSLQVISVRLLEKRHRHTIRDFLGVGGSQHEHRWLSTAIWYKPSKYGHSSSLNHWSDGRHFLKKAGKPVLTSITQNSWVCILGPKSLPCKVFPYSALP